MLRIVMFRIYLFYTPNFMRTVVIDKLPIVGLMANPELKGVPIDAIIGQDYCLNLNHTKFWEILLKTVLSNVYRGKLSKPNAESRINAEVKAEFERLSKL